MAHLPVSVIVPAFNRAEVIGRALRTVASQTALPREVLVIDDGSTDQTASVAREHGARVIKLDRNSGVSAARNAGIEAAEHEWLAMLDSDDEWLPHHLATLWSMRGDHGLVFTSTLIVGGDAPPWICGPLTEGPIRSPAGLLQPFNVVPTSCVLIQRTLVRQVGGFDVGMTHAEDLDLWLRVVERTSAQASIAVTARNQRSDVQATRDHEAMGEAHRLLIERYSNQPWWHRRISTELEALDTWDDFRRRLSNRSPDVLRAVTKLTRPRRVPSLVRALRSRAKLRHRSTAHQSDPAATDEVFDPWTIEIDSPSRVTRWRSRAQKVRDLSILLPDRNRAAYIGWLGHANAGDTAVLDGYRSAFSSLSLRPLSPDGEFLRRVTGLPRAPRFGAVMLGGGTLIGTERTRQALELLHHAAPDVPLAMLGTGVEDPAWEAPYARDIALELPRWRGLLREFKGGLGVRGPRSMSILADIGVEAHVVGDPALLVGETSTRPSRGGTPVLAINIGLARHIYGGRPTEVLDRLTDAGNMAIEQGWIVHVLPVWRRDVGYSQALVERLGPRAHLFTDTIDVEPLLTRLAVADAIIGMKLHSVVLAAAVGTPGLMVAYHPKCVDFQESIGRDAAIVRTDELRDDRFLQAAEQLLADHAQSAIDVARAVSDLRTRLRSQAASITRWIEHIDANLTSR
jgi:glycosyltransferase involved in cell wall biosynthesis